LPRGLSTNPKGGYGFGGERLTRAEECEREQDTFVHDIKEDHWESL